MTLEEIIEMFPDEEFLIADGFDGAIIGFLWPTEYLFTCI